MDPTIVQDPQHPDGGAALVEDEPRERWPRAEMRADEALERLRRGETVQHVRIHRLRLHGDFTAPVRLRDVHLVQPQFEGANFQDEVIFTNCCLEKARFTRRTTFAKALVLSGSTLVQFHMANVAVEGALQLNNVQCRGRFLLTGCAFGGHVNFWEATVRCWLDIKDCAFAGVADFRSLHAEQGFVLTKCTFTKDVLFRGASVAKKLEVRNSRFEGLVDFSKAKLHDYVYLETMEQGPDQKFAFLNALGERLLVGIPQLEGRLASEGERRWGDAMHEYAYLKRSFASLHRHDEEDWAYYQFKVNQRRACGRSWARPWTKVAQFFDWLLLDQGCGYCTSPIRAVRTAFIILFAFALIYSLGFEHLHVDRVPFPDVERAAWPNRLMVSVVTSVAAFTSGLSGIKDVAKGWMNVPLVIEALLGTLLWGLFIVAFSRKVIR